jgi:hypothetical protein
MIGVIILTLTLVFYTKKQDLFLQVNRDFINCIIVPSIHSIKK